MQKLCDDLILPLNAVDYASRVKDEVFALKQRYKDDFLNNNISFNFIEEYTGVIDQLQIFLIRLITVKSEMILSLPENFLRKAVELHDKIDEENAKLTKDLHALRFV